MGKGWQQLLRGWREYPWWLCPWEARAPVVGSDGKQTPPLVLTQAIPLPNLHMTKSGSWLELFLMILYNQRLIDCKSTWRLERKRYI